MASAPEDRQTWTPWEMAAQGGIALAGTADGAAVDEAGVSVAGAAALITTLLLGVVLAGWSVLRATAEHPFSLPRLVPVPPG